MSELNVIETSCLGCCNKEKIKNTVPITYQRVIRHGTGYWSL